jgi:hypothetical protein
MFWFFVPIGLIALIIILSVAVYSMRVRDRGGSGERDGAQTVYDRDQQRKSPQAPPAG